jgi:hypothetical protein
MPAVSSYVDSVYLNAPDHVELVGACLGAGCEHRVVLESK